MNLEAVQHVLTAQMISSMQEGQLCRSLRYLAEPTELSESDVNNLPQDALSFVLAAVPNEEAASTPQWYRLVDARQLNRPPIKYCFSAIAALPLPVWPFYLLGDLNIGAHLECYVAAYFPTIDVQFSSPDLHLNLGSQRLSVTLPIGNRLMCSRYGGPEAASFSYYVEGVSAVSIAVKKNPSHSQNLPSFLSKEPEFFDLSNLQYEGPVSASKLVSVAPDLTLQAHTYFDRRANQSREVTHRKLMDLTTHLRNEIGAVDPATLVSEIFAMPDGSIGIRSR